MHYAALVDNNASELSAAIGAKVRAERQSREWTLDQLAKYSGVSRRIKRRNDRPLLQIDDPEAKLRELIDLRYPTYALADLTVQSRDVVHEKIVDEMVAVLAKQLGFEPLVPPI